MSTFQLGTWSPDQTYTEPGRKGSYQGQNQSQASEGFSTGAVTLVTCCQTHVQCYDCRPLFVATCYELSVQAFQTWLNTVLGCFQVTVLADNVIMPYVLYMYTCRHLAKGHQLQEQLWLFMCVYHMFSSHLLPFHSSPQTQISIAANLQNSVTRCCFWTSRYALHHLMLRSMHPRSGYMSARFDHVTGAVKWTRQGQL